MTEAMQRYRRSLSFRAKREILLDIHPFLQIHEIAIGFEFKQILRLSASG
jgi:hypothetical protein